MIKVKFEDLVEARHKVELRIILKSLRDPEFRQRLLEDPTKIYSEELGVIFPQELKVELLQEDATTLYLALPAHSPEYIQIAGPGEAQELSDEALESMSGGLNSPTLNSNELVWVSRFLLENIMDNK